MDFTNKLIYIYDTQKWNMTILTIRIEKEEKKNKNHPSLSLVRGSVTVKI